MAVQQNFGESSGLYLSTSKPSTGFHERSQAGILVLPITSQTRGASTGEQKHIEAEAKRRKIHHWTVRWSPFTRYNRNYGLDGL
jgi:hypothetical protein